MNMRGLMPGVPIAIIAIGTKGQTAGNIKMTGVLLSATDFFAKLFGNKRYG